MVAIIEFIFQTAFGIINALLELTFDLIKAIINAERKTSYDADFIPSDNVLSTYNHGFNLTGTKALTKQASFSNCSVFGPSGSGKSSVIILPTIYSLSRGESSICCNDPSGELYEKISAYLAQSGYRVLRIDFSSSPGNSEGFNPLQRCKTVSEIQQVAHLILRNTVGDSKGDPFWDRSAEMLITLFARYLVVDADPEDRTMTNVLRLVETFATNPKKMDKLCAATNIEEGLLLSYKSTIVINDKTLQSIIATTRAALNIFSDPTVIHTTSIDTIDFASFRKDKVALFICNPIQHIHYYKPLSALFFESMFNEIMSRIPLPSERSIFILLEEAATMKFSSLSTTISNIRKYRAGIMVVVQDYQALVALYGQSEAHNIRTNTYAQVYLKNQPLETCKELEAILGRFTYTGEKDTEKIRHLMSADEIRKSDDAIILCGNHAPIKAKMTPYYERYKLNKISQIPPFKPQTILSQTPPALIPL